jgi:predicted kinase
MRPFIFCMGLPGTGKTETSLILERELEGYFRLSIPEIRKELGLEPYDRSEKGIELMRDYFQEIDERIRKGERPIIDRAGSKYEIRASYYQQATEHHEKMLLLYLNCPEHVAKERIKNRPDPKDSALPINDPKEYDRIFSMWEDPKDSHDQLWHFILSIAEYNTQRNIITPFKIHKDTQETYQIITNILKANSPIIR